jgi:hypothetical protein
MREMVLVAVLLLSTAVASPLAETTLKRDTSAGGLKTIAFPNCFEIAAASQWE